MGILLSAQHIYKSFGTRDLFEDLTIAIEDGDRVALIGANGSGKSTLLNIMARIEEPDQGQVIWRKDLLVSYVAQQVPYDERQTVNDTFKHALIDCDDAQRIARMSRWLRYLPGIEPLSTISELSGGQRKRLQLVVGFAMQPNVLLLDEPTNHLDLDGIEWLESLLEGSTLAVVFITHDRYLIEKRATKVFEIAPWYSQGFLETRGHYSEFLERRANYLNVREQTHASLANKARRELEWLRRTPSAQRTKSKSRVKAAKELLSDVAGYRSPEERAGFDFANSNRKTHDLVKVLDVGMAYGDKWLFKSCGLTLSPGMRLGIVGANGSGKSSLLKIIAGTLKPSIGRTVPALGCRFVYFDQHRRTLPPDLTLRNALCPEGDSVLFNGKLIHVTAWAKRFLFKPEHLGKRISDLSGGELARATLAHLMREPADVLLLDEPTNDLDISTLEVLEEALQEFDGAVVLVSHDRYFLNRVCTSLLGILHGAVLTFSDYQQWAEQRATSKKQISEDRKTPNEKRVEQDTVLAPRKKALTYGERIELGKIERKIEKLELHLQTLEQQIHTPELAADHKRLEAHWEEYEKTRNEIEAHYDRWSYLEYLQKKSDAE